MKMKNSHKFGVLIIALGLLSGCADNDETNKDAQQQAQAPVTFDTYAKEVFDCLEDSEPFVLEGVDITDQYPDKLASFESILTP